MKRNTSVVVTLLIMLLTFLGLSMAAGASPLAEPDAPLAGAPTVVGYQGQVTVAGVATAVPVTSSSLSWTGPAPSNGPTPP